MYPQKWTSRYQIKGRFFNFEALPLQYGYPCHSYEELFEKLRFDPHYHLYTEEQRTNSYFKNFSERSHFWFCYIKDTFDILSSNFEKKR